MSEASAMRKDGELLAQQRSLMLRWFGGIEVVSWGD